MVGNFSNIPAFTPRRTEEEREKDPRHKYDIEFTEDEFKEHLEAQRLLEQTKDRTAIKQVWKIGIANLLYDKKTNQILDTISNNRRKNKRTGADPEIEV